MQSRKMPISNDEFLTFTLGKEEYGIDILRVQKIRGCDADTQASRPAYTGCSGKKLAGKPRMLARKEGGEEEWAEF